MESIESPESPRPDDAALGVIQSGLSAEPEFWAVFMRLCGDTLGLSKLLDVPEHRIASWSGQIQKALDASTAAMSPEGDGKNKTLHTGLE